jgi:DNA-directed RNA polymerase specialized sigma24 family protein
VYYGSPAQRERGYIYYLPPVSKEKRTRRARPEYADFSYFQTVFNQPGLLPHGKAMIDSLTATQYRVCVLRYLRGLTAEEIAREMGDSERAVRRVLARAKERMRQVRLAKDTK